jgi:hypothetical protein
MSKFKAILIDPAKQSVNDVEWDDEDSKQLHAWLGTDSLDHTPSVPYFDRHVIAWVDDIGMMKPELDTFFVPGLYHQPLCGPALLWAAIGEDTADIPFDAASLRPSIKWTGKVKEVYPGGPQMGHASEN